MTKHSNTEPAHFTEPDAIEVRGARVHNLKNLSLDVPLRQLVGIAGVSGSGKSSLALGVLYAEGSRRYLEALSTYTRRRISQSGRAAVDEVLHVPAALALRQRPGVPGVHSTFGTSTELLNHLRLMFSRLASHRCPHGHANPPTLNVALEQPITCCVCGEEFYGPGAEEMAFNSGGACQTCGGTGVVRTIDESTLIPDPTLTLDEGAVAPWRQLMWSLMAQVAGEMGVRTDVPYQDLTDEEKEIVLHGPMEKRHILYVPKNKDSATELDFTYYSAVNTVKNALSKVKDEKGMARVAKFLCESPCPACHGTRLSEKVRGSKIDGLNLAQVTAFTLDELRDWLPTVAPWLPADMRPMCDSITAEMIEPIQRLEQLGLGYLALDRASDTLSNGERQRVALTRAVRSRTTGVLYVLDEPSIGLHPANVEGLLGVMDDLLSDGNSVVMVDHDVAVLRHANHLIEIGPGSGADGGRVIAQGSVADVEANPASRIGPFLAGAAKVRVRTPVAAEHLFDEGAIRIETGAIHTVHPLEVSIPKGRLTVVTGVSGSGKTTLVLESLVAGLKASTAGTHLPAHVHDLDAPGIARVDLVDATPIGVNVRSTVGTYSGVLDDLRREFAKLPEAKERGLKAGAFSYNTGSLRCPTCDGTGQISLDVQFLPDVDIPCPDCRGSRYSKDAYAIQMAIDGEVTLSADAERERTASHETSHKSGTARHQHADDFESVHTLSLPEVLTLTVDQALVALAHLKKVRGKLEILSNLGLGYLTLGEATPALSGGEAQRLKLASEMRRNQDDTLFVFDEPTIGLHPLDVETLIGVLQNLIEHGATVVVIEHDLDMIANADYLIDMGPGGGEQGGRIVVEGTPAQVAVCPESITGRYLARELEA
ncbi:excinuclease ABC subunit UvrA [Adlercreutzia shanghongiae]|uniref:UvrABC system protein A n=1 Tax=Adlercreutzia shanghongiae TaxID=3111773 RepID=A0ABU6IVZ8_9ACTN|nr:excinuclease ABC subunit UvrA [Adlercreutzia sp. R22]MEC4294006.1 excinuclease ABC subunit UvrA [Adlercreutzia sp. R22]